NSEIDANNPRPDPEMWKAEDSWGAEAPIVERSAPDRASVQARMMTTRIRVAPPSSCSSRWRIAATALRGELVAKSAELISTSTVGTNHAMVLCAQRSPTNSAGVSGARTCAQSRSDLRQLGGP